MTCMGSNGHLALGGVAVGWLLLAPLACAGPEGAVPILDQPVQAPAWAVPFGREPWRRAPVAGADVLDLGDVMDRVSHALRVDPGTGQPAVRSRRYHAEFDARGFRLWTPGAAEGMAFRTLELRRGDHRVSTAGTPERVALGNVAQARLAEGLVEHLEARAQGVTVTWLLQAPPAGTGDLVVRAELSGMDLLVQSESGLHLAGRADGTRVVVGPATAVDARQRAWPLRTAWEAGSLRVEVPAAVLQEAVFPLAVDPVIGPELALDVPALDTGSAAEADPAVAHGTDYLVVWQAQGISGVRVASDGTLLDPRPLPLSSDVGAQHPRVAARGDLFLVVWHTAAGDIWGARTQAGAVLDPDGLWISAAALTQGYPAVAATGTDFLVAWQDGRSGVDSDVYAARVREVDGAVLDPGGIPVASAAGDQLQPAVACNGVDCLVAWTDRGGGTADVAAARVAADGSVRDPGGVLVGGGAGDQVSPAVATNGTDFLVTWQDQGGAAPPDVRAARVAADGTLLDPAGVAVAVATGAQARPSAAGNGVDYLVAWQDDRGSAPLNVAAARVQAADGTVRDLAGLAVSTAAGAQDSPVVASDGTDFLVAWRDTRNGGADIRGARVQGTDGAVLDGTGVLLSSSAPEQPFPAVASNGTDFLVAWQEARGGSVDILGARVHGGDGALLDPAGLVLSNAAQQQGHPSVASNGADYLVAWEDFRSSASYDVYGTRVRGSDGSVLDPAGLPLGTAAGHQLAPAVAGNGVDYLVVWQDGQGGLGYDVSGVRVASADGALKDPAPLSVSTAAGDQLAPRLACNRASCLVAWQDYRDGTSDVWATRVDAADGTVLEPAGLPVSQAANAQSAAAVASDGTDFLVAWQDNRTGSSLDILGARVRGADGGVLDVLGLDLCTAPRHQGVPEVVFARGRYVVLWQDQRRDRDEVWGTRVTPATGALQDGDAASGGFQVGVGTNPRAAATASGQVLVTLAAGRWGSARALGHLAVVHDAPVLAPVGDRTVMEALPLVFTVSATDPDGDPLSYSASNLPAGAAFDGATHTFSWTPGYLAAGSYPHVRFTVSDGERETSEEITVTVANTDRPPAWDPLDHKTGAEGQRLDFVVHATDPDPDTTLTYSAEGLPAGADFDPATQRFSWTPGYDDAGSYPGVRFRVWDGEASAFMDLTITVTNTDRAPVMEHLGDFTVAEGQELGFTVHAADPDANTVLRYSALSLPAGADFDVTTQTFSWVPGFDQAGNTPPIRFSVTDGELSAAEFVSITVTNTNRPPVLQPVGDRSVSEGHLLAFSVTAQDPDVDTVLRCTASNLPPDAVFTTSGCAFSWTPARGTAGSYPGVVFTVSDGELAATDTVTLTVTQDNLAPVAQAASRSLDEDRPVTLRLSGSDGDGDVLAFQVTEGPAHGTLTGTPPEMTYLPAPDFHGEDAFLFTVTDGVATSPPARVDLQVLPVNDAPVAVSQDLEVVAGQELEVSLLATDVDGDPLSFQVVAAPAHGTLTGTPPALRFRAGGCFAGVDGLRFTAADGLLVSEASVQIRVLPADGGCGDAGTLEDGGPADAGDGTPDAAFPADSGDAPDAADASVPDAAPPADAAVPDAARPDAARPDAGGGQRDAGSDAGTADAGADGGDGGKDGGCTCGTSADTPAVPAAFLLLAALGRRHRTRQGARP